MDSNKINSDLDAARLLNDISSANLQRSVNSDVLHTLLNDYFSENIQPESEDGTEDMCDSDSDEEVCDGIFQDNETVEEKDELLNIQQGTTTGAPPSFFVDYEYDNCCDKSESEAEECSGVIEETDNVMKNVGNFVCMDKEEELKKISEFSCSCSASKNGLCFKLLDEELIYSLRLGMCGMTDFEKDLVLIGKVSSMMNVSSQTECTKRKKQSDRKRQRTTYYVEGRQVCRKAFEYIHAISGEKLDACIRWYKANGLTPRYKKSGGRRRNQRFLSHFDILNVVNFIQNYAEDHAILLPGRVPNHKDTRIKLLPSSMSKSSIFRLYRAAMQYSDHRAVKISTFRKLWKSLLPFIVQAKPMTDLCWTCQQNNYSVYRSANLPDVVKSRKLLKQEEHLRIVDLERQEYKRMVTESKKTISSFDIPQLGNNTPCSRDIRMHYSFDFAQQVHLPSDPLQPGPMYFLTPRKCGLFGICCEGLPMQINYLIDEASCSSKGSSAVISYIHHFFKSFGLGEKKCDLHCDNCSGQNKNRYMLWYLAWRVINGLHDEITLNFLITGHTKFSPDWCFGLIKQQFRKTRVCSLTELATVVKKSTEVSNVNIPQLVMDENGEMLVDHFDWSDMLSPFFKAIQGIKSYQHFRFTAANPGFVFCKESVESEEVMFQILKNPNAILPSHDPRIILPPGLSSARQWYLFEKIREFCSEETQDITCPRPMIPKSFAEQNED